MTEEFDPSDEITPAEIVRITGDIVAAHVSNNSVDLSNMPALIANVHGALAGLASFTAQAQPATEQIPFVSPRASIKPDYLICLECGAKQKILKRHLEQHHQLSPKEYRAKWGLKGDYPMVAPNYSEHRRTMAISLGLGKKGRGAGKAKNGKTRTALVG